MMAELDDQADQIDHAPGEDSLDLDRDDDRLPWLESADDPGDEGGHAGRIAGLVLVGLVALAAVVGLVYWLQTREGAVPKGDGSLIAAPAGDYKVPPKDPQAARVQGTGDTSFAASQGKRVEAKVADAAGAPPPANSVLVQLGAYSTEPLAATGWQTLSSRHDVLSGMPHRIAAATVDGGTVYRLSAITASVAAANQVCDALKKAGENCIVIR